MSERVAQVLSLHRITPRCYDLSSVRTGSVRDQLIRATLFADALVSSGLVAVKSDPKDDPQEAQKKRRVLVMGAGVAGLATALNVARLGADVTIVERETYPFGSLANCNWRTVDPTEYDWPHPHWNQGRLPIDLPNWPSPASPLPLPQIRLEASALAHAWSTTHGAILFPPVPGVPIAYGAGSVAILYGHDADDLFVNDRAAANALATRAPGQHMLSVRKAAATPLVAVDANGWTDPTWLGEQFAAVVSSIGFGKEITFEWPVPQPRQPGDWNDYEGHGFWKHYDGMRKVGFMPGPGGVTPSAILISGSGDGAMQDFQRAATGLFGRALYERISLSVGAGRFRPEPLMLNAVLAEDHARRAHGWRPDGSKIGDALAYWHEQFVLAVDQVWTGWSVLEQSTVANLVLRTEVVNYLQRRTGTSTSVQWVIRESVPTFSYGLNRFLSFLVLRMMQHLRSQAPVPAVVPPIFLTRHQISQITPVGHTCNHAPEFCYARMHDVELTDLDARTSYSCGPYDLIVIRHGQDPSPLLGGASVPEQQVPFDLPR